MGIVERRGETEYECDFCSCISTESGFFAYIEEEESEEFANMIACSNCFKNLETIGKIKLLRGQDENEEEE